MHPWHLLSDRERSVLCQVPYIAKLISAGSLDALRGVSSRGAAFTLSKRRRVSKVINSGPGSMAYSALTAFIFEQLGVEFIAPKDSKCISFMTPDSKMIVHLRGKSRGANEDQLLLFSGLGSGAVVEFRLAWALEFPKSADGEIEVEWAQLDVMSPNSFPPVNLLQPPAAPPSPSPSIDPGPDGGGFPPPNPDPDQPDLGGADDADEQGNEGA